MCKHVLFLTILVCATATAMNIEWVHPTGQYPAESGPVLADADGDGQPELVAVNRLGQVMVWRMDGSSVGQGQDGAVAQLPEGQWTSPPALLGKGESRRWLFCSVEGRVAALDGHFKQIWETSLSGKTSWGSALPALLEEEGGAGPRACYGDESGALTCLDVTGKVLWRLEPKMGSCQSALLAHPLPGGETCILASLGSTLCAISTSGAILRSLDLGQELSTEPVDCAGGAMILCGTAKGDLVAVDGNGSLRWRASVGDEVAAIASVVDPETRREFILCTGLWGSLHAFDLDGKALWAHHFNSKTRGCPVLFDADGDTHAEILLPCYNHHLYAFKQDGTLSDDMLLSGLLNANPLLVSGPNPGVVLITSYLLAYRLSAAEPASPYGAAGLPKDLSVTLLGPDAPDEAPRVQVDNPEGALLSVNVFTPGPDATPRITGRLTARSRLEIPVDADAKTVRAVVKDVRGQVLVEQQWPLSADSFPKPQEPAPNTITAWAAAPYGSFDASRTLRTTSETEQAVHIAALYQNEVDQGAFIAASTFAGTQRVRITVDTPAREDKTAFGGTITLREAVPVPTLNGESVADALPALNGGVVVIAGPGAAKVWVSADAHHAEPGSYNGKIHVRPLDRELPETTLDLCIDVPPLALPNEFPLRLCTWDYVPNQWFPSACADMTLDDMVQHGVSIYPRTSVPAAQMDAAGNLNIDWTKLDTDLDLLKGRGQLLVQVGLPAITFAEPPSGAAKHGAELAYVTALRDHLMAHGLGYTDFAFYPTDEPGLDLGKNLSALTDAAELFREADPKLRIYTDPVPSLCWKDFERIEPLIDVWCPNMRLVSGLVAKDPRIERIMQSGKPVWSYECVSQVKSLSPLCYNRADAWRGYHFGLTGIGMWTHSTTLDDTWVRAKNFNDEYGLVYPGVPPVPSARWEALRDGLEDTAAMGLLQERITMRRKAGTHAELISEAEKELRMAQTDVMEISDPAYVESRDYLDKGHRRIWHTATDEALYRQHRQRIAELTQRLGEE